MDRIRAPVRFGELEVMHEFVIVDSLVAPSNSWHRFLHNNALLLDFSETPVRVHNYPLPQSETSVAIAQVLPIYQGARKEQAKPCAIAGIEQPATDITDECAIPMYQNPISFELPECSQSSLMTIVHKYQSLFHTTPGSADAAHHFISTNRNPVMVRTTMLDTSPLS